jgi:hypothetical protein
MEFFLKGLNPFKIQTIFKLDLFPRFVYKNPFGIWISFQKKSCSFWIYLPTNKVWKFLDNRMCNFCIFQAWISSNIEKRILNRFLGQPTVPCSPPMLNGPDPSAKAHSHLASASAVLTPLMHSTRPDIRHRSRCPPVSPPDRCHCP